MKKIVMLNGAKTFVTSSYNYKNRTTLVRIVTEKKSYEGKAVWNPDDPFNPAIGYQIAYERAYAEYLKDNSNIIEMCGGLRSGDWVCEKAPNSNTPPKWGIVCDNCIYYMIGSDGFDFISTFREKGDTGYFKITKVIRGKYCTITLNIIKQIIKDPFLLKTVKEIDVYEID